MQQNSPIIQWSRLVCGYSVEDPLTEPFSGKIEKPGIYAITGPNGSGKSTLLRTWLGFVKPLSGSFDFDHEYQRKSYVPQKLTLNPYFHLDVRTCVAQGYGPSKKEDEQEILNILKEWDLLESANKNIHLLSSGQKIRLLVARALLFQPKLILMDEPLSNLDSHCQDWLVQKLLSLVKNQGLCVLLVDHHVEKFSKLLSGNIEFIRPHLHSAASLREWNTCQVKMSGDIGANL